MFKIMFFLVMINHAVCADEVYIELAKQVDVISRNLILEKSLPELTSVQSDTLVLIEKNEKDLKVEQCAVSNQKNKKTESGSSWTIRALTTYAPSMGSFSSVYDYQQLMFYYKLKEAKRQYLELSEKHQVPLRSFETLSESEKLNRIIFLENSVNAFMNTKTDAQIKVALLTLHQNELSGMTSSLPSNPAEINTYLPAFAFFELVQNSSNEKKTQNEVLSKYADKLTTEQKFQMAQISGYIMSENYDYDRKAGINNKEKGEVTLEKILQAEKQDLNAGVCRDISLAQTQLLKGLGINDCYVINYAATSAHHSTVACADPDDRKKIHLYNYGSRSLSDGTNGSAVFTPFQAKGLNYQITNNEGRSVASLPSEFMDVLREQAGFERSDYEPHSKNISTVQSIVLARKTSDGKPLFQGNLFYGTLSSGEKVVGVASKGTLQGSTTVSSQKGELALSAVHETQKLNDKIGANLHGKVQLESSNILPSETTSLKFQSQMVADGGIYSVKENHSTNGFSTFHYDGAGNLQVGAVIEKKGERLEGRAEAHAYLTPGVKNISENPVLGNLILYSPIKVLKADVSYTTHDYQLLGAASVALRGQLGQTVDAKVGVKNRNQLQSVSIGYEGSLTDKTPYFIPGSERKIYIDATQRDFFNHFDLYLTVEKPIEKKSDPRFKVKAEGHL